jgi:hypothetical protein
MFTRERWRQQIAERLDRFARNPHQEIRLAGVSTPLPYLVAQTLSPFCEALHQEPINAIETLASITRGAGADQIVKEAFNRQYQSAVQTDREMRAGKEYRATIEDLLIELQTILIARQSFARRLVAHESGAQPGSVSGRIRAAAAGAERSGRESAPSGPERSAGTRRELHLGRSGIDLGRFAG